MPGSTLVNLGLTGDIADHATSWGTVGRANDRMLDSLVMPAVKSVLNTPPGAPSNGDRHLIGTSPVAGVWASNANAIAEWNSTLGVWEFYTPKAGWVAYDVATKIVRRYTTAWFNSELAVNVRQFSVTGDGTTDDEPALNLLFDYVGALSITGGPTAGPATVYFPKGTYLIKTPVVIDGENNTSAISGLRIIADPGTVIKMSTVANWTAANAGLFTFRSSVTPATDVVIDGFVFDGGAIGTTSKAAPGIFTYAITGLTVRNCTFQSIGDTALGVASSPRNDGILLGDASSGSSARAKDVLIEKCRFVNIVRNGISGLDVDGLTIENCYFDNMDNSGIDCEPNLATQFARDIKISRCTFTNYSQQAVVITPGTGLFNTLYAAQMEGLKVSNCYMDGSTTGKAGVQVRGWIDVDVSNNTVIRVADPGIYLRSCQSVRVTNNNIRDITSTTGAILVDMPDAAIQPQDHIIQGNRIKNTAGYGIRVADLDTGSIEGNVIRNYDTALALRTGISLLISASTCKNVGVRNNTVVGGGGAGGVSGGGKPIVIGQAFPVSCTAAGTTTLTSAALFGSVLVGYTVSGSGVTAGTTVTAKASTSSITVSAAVTAGAEPLTRTFYAGCTRILCVGNICQENGDQVTPLATDAIDNDAASTVHGFNADEQRTSRLFTGIGNTPFTGTIVGQGNENRKTLIEITVDNASAAGSVSTVSDIVNTANAGNVIFSAINAAAASMMTGTANPAAASLVGVYCTRTATGFDLVHNGNNTGSAAIFQCMLIPN